MHHSEAGLSFIIIFFLVERFQVYIKSDLEADFTYKVFSEDMVMWGKGSSLFFTAHKMSDASLQKVNKYSVKY